MALASQLTHKLLMNTALPYQTFTSPIDQDPQYVGGRNVQINAKAYCTMRPGFADFLEPAPTTFHHLLRIFQWARWDGTYFVMAVDELPTGQMAVYKFQVGTDQSFSQILLEENPPPAQVPLISGVPFSFTTANNYLFISNPSMCRKWSPDHGLQNWGILSPSFAPTVAVAAGGVLTAVNGGYSYVLTYVNSASGHESSPGPVSAILVGPTPPPTSSTGDFNACNINLSWPYWGAPDPQVDRINIYRTFDGGARAPQDMAFVAQVSASTTSYVDSTPDASLSAVQFAPPFYQNDPPKPMHSIILYAGRIWGVVGAKVWYSGQEEITNGVPQESFPGFSINAADGNYYAYETQVTALAPLTDGVAVFNANRIQKIEGDALDNFRRYTMLNKRGTVTDYTVRVVGNSMLWFDRSKQVWLSDAGEIGKDIRPDLSTVSLTSAQAAIHIAGEQHWILLLDPDNGLLYVYDLDLQGWNVPWTVEATTIESIDLSPGVTKLAAALHGTQVRLENPGLYLDGTAQYDAWLLTNAFNLAPDSNPDFLGTLDHIAIESNQFQPVSVAVKTDEDAMALTAASHSDVGLGGYGGFNPLRQVTDPPRRTNGTYLVQKNYVALSDPAAPACRRLALRLDWRQPEPALWALYSIDLGILPAGK